MFKVQFLAHPNGDWFDGETFATMQDALSFAKGKFRCQRVLNTITRRLAPLPSSW